MLCEQESGSTIYLNPEYEYCYYLLLDEGGDLEAQVNAFDIIYRPSNQIVELLFYESEKRSIHLTDMNGQILSRVQSAENNVHLSLKESSKGMHVISVVQNDGRFMSKKMMVY